MESAQFSRLEENFRPVGRFWDFWPSKIRFGQNVLRMTWKERFVQFSWKAHCFPVLKRIWGQCDDFDNFDAHKCDLAKTCCAWPEKNVCTIFTKSAHFLPFEENLRPVWRFWELWRSQMRFGQNVLRMTWKERLYNFYEKRTLSTFWREFETSVTILKTLTLKNAIWWNRAAHDLKIAFCTIFMKSALFSLFGETLRPAWRFWQLWRSQIRFGQNMLRMTWKERFVQFSKKAHSFLFSERSWGQCDDFDNFDTEKCDSVKTCCAWPERSVLYNFYGNCTVFLFRREF